jgi:hypothetical protein
MRRVMAFCHPCTQSPSSQRGCPFQLSHVSHLPHSVVARSSCHTCLRLTVPARSILRHPCPPTIDGKSKMTQPLSPSLII